MAIDHRAAGGVSSPALRTWTDRDSLLYALSVGAGAADPVRELALTTENTAGVPQEVLPTFATVLARRTPDALDALGPVDTTRVVHAAQRIVVHRPLTPSGSGEATSQIVDISDKGSGALVVVRTDLQHPDGGPWVTSESSTFLRGEGGFDPGRAPSADGWTRPSRPADRQVEQHTRPDQALLYRLNGDRNPLHSDPGFARRAGFDRPILHGLCTYGFAGRAVREVWRDLTGRELEVMSGRFSAPVWPGDELRTLVWCEDDCLQFVVERADGTVVVDRGGAC